MRADHFESLRLSIEATLITESSGGDVLARYKRCAGLAEETIGKIREELTGQPFADKQEEIEFYKEVAPRVWGCYLYFKRLVKIEAGRKVRSPERFRMLLERELNRAQLFPEKHKICEYYYEGLTDSDERYFIRRTLGDTLGVFLAHDVPKGTYLLAWMRAFEMLRVWLAEALEDIDDQHAGPGQRSKLALKIGVMEALELLKSMHLHGVFDDWTFKEVVKWGEETFGIRIMHHDSLLQDMARRQKRTIFLDSLKNDLDKKL